MPVFAIYGFRISNDPLYFLLIALVIVSFIIQGSLRRTFAKYAKVHAASGKTAEEAVAAILSANGVSDITVEGIQGELTDHYNPKKRSIGLSQVVYGSDSLAALGVAAHEAGHVLQEAKGFMPVRFHRVIAPAARLGGWVAPALVIFGFILHSMGLVWLGIGLYAAILLYFIVTLPLEFDASKRAVQALVQGDIINPQEAPAVRKVLNMAAMTYVIAALTALVQLVRMIMLGSRSRN